VNPAFQADPDPAKRRLFISDDNGKEIFVLKAGSDGLFGTSDNGHLYIVGKPETNVAEMTTTGGLVQNVDISAANADKPAGLAYAPGSPNPGVMNLYIVQRGVDNDSDPKENDGKLYEMSLLATPPAGPTDLAATAASESRIDLVWTDNATDEDGFEIERSTGGGADWTRIDNVGANVTTYSDPTVAPNSAYSYRVRAFNGSGQSDFSNTAGANTPDGLVLTATGYKVKGKHTVDLSWSGRSSVKEIDIYRDGAIITTVANSGAYTDNIGQKGGGSYLYQICEAGSLTACSNPVQVVF
jgi:hypothetical protein